MTVYLETRFRPSARTYDILSGRTVRAVHWIDAANALNYALAFGGQQIPFYCPDVLVNSGSSVTLHHYVRRRLRCRGRLWAVWVISSDPAAASNFDITIAGTTFSRAALYPEGGSSAIPGPEQTPFLFIEDLAASQADTTEDKTVQVQCTVGGVYVSAVACYELPRGFLEEDTTDYGTLPEAMVTGRPILASNVSRMITACKDFRGTAPRNGHFYWCSDDSGVTVSNTSFADFFAADIYALPPRYARTDTSNSKIRVNVYSKSSAGTCTLDWRVITDVGTYNGTGSTSTTFGWRGPLAITQNDEDLTTSNGIQAGKTGQIQIQFKKTGVGNGLVRAISIYEDT